MEDRPSGGGTEGIDLPAPHSSPLYVALGLALLLASLVTNIIFAYMGALITIWGAVGWWRQMLPVEHKERIAPQSSSERAPEPDTGLGTVEHLIIGRDRHRMRLPTEYRPYSSGLKGGIAGGIAMAVVAGIHGLIAGGSLWASFNGFASIVMPLFGAEIPADMTSFHPEIMLAALAVHVSLSLLIGLVYASVLPMLPGHPRLWGGIVAPFVWTAAGFLCVDLVEPEAIANINWFWFVLSQIVFGITAGEVITRSEPVKTLQSLPLVARAGLEAVAEEENS